MIPGRGRGGGGKEEERIWRGKEEGGGLIWFF